MGTGSRYARPALKPGHAFAAAPTRSSAAPACATLLAAFGLASAASHAGAASDSWIVGTNGLYSTNANWTGGNVPNGASDVATVEGPASVVDFTASNTVTLSRLDLGLLAGTGNPVFGQSGGSLTVGTLNLGGGGGTRNPRYNMTGGTLSITSQSFNWGAGNDVQFNLNGGTVDYGTGTNAATIGSSSGGAIGVLDIDAGTFNHNGTGQFQLGRGSNARSSVIMSGGTLNTASTALRIGSANGGTGNVDLSGNAKFNATGASGTIYLGNNGGSGHITIGGTAEFNAAGYVLSVGQFGNTTGNQGTVTMSGGTLRVQRASLGGDNAASGIIGVMNLDGGVVETGQIRRNPATTTVSATQNVINANGGKVVVTANAGNASFFDGAFVNLAAGGLTLDTNGNATGINNAMSGVGGLTKLGSGTLTLSGANAYTGSTKVAAGAVALGATDVLADASTLSLEGGTLVTGGAAELVGLLDLASSTASILQFGDADATAHALTFGGIGAGAGTLTVTNWTNAVDQLLFTSLADAESIAARTSFQDPNGSSGVVGAMVVTNGSNFEVVAVPEPASLALLALGGVCAFGRRRRD